MKRIRTAFFVVIWYLAWCVNVTLPAACAASPPTAPAAPTRPAGGIGSTSSSLSLNLGSANSIGTASVLSGFKPVTINVNGSQMKVDANSNLTSGQLAAVQQVLSTGRQSLILNSDGSARAGSLSMAGFVNLSGLVVPHGVSVIEKINASSQTTAVAGLLQNSGTMAFFSGLGNHVQATLSAQTIENLIGGTIFGGPNVDLMVSATQSISNSGIINAVNNLSVLTPVLNNGGTIKSDSGNVSIASPTSALNITGSGGTIKALNGAVNLSTAGGTPAITLNGGDYLSQQLNIDATNGTLLASLNKVTGLVNINAACSTFGADTAALKFGTLNITGDPTFYNSGGSILLTGTVSQVSSLLSPTHGADLAFIASGDVIIKPTSGFVNVSTANTNTSGNLNGGNLLVVAGANITAPAPPSQGNNDTSTSVTFTGPSGSGGAIDFTGVNTIDTSGGGGLATNVVANGGSVTMVAFAGTGAGNGRTSGTINLGGAAVNTYGNGLGTGGDVTLIAGATADPIGGHAINVANVIQTGGSTVRGSFVGGNISAITATPLISAPITVNNGTIQGGSGTISASPTSQATSILIGTIQTSPLSQASRVSQVAAAPQPISGNVTLRAGTTITTGQILTYGKAGLQNNIGPGGQGGQGGDVNITAGGSVSITGQIATNGDQGLDGSTGAGGAGGNGGNVSITSTKGNITITPTGSIGIISMGGNGYSGDAEGADGGAGGNGGNVTLTALNGTIKVNSIEGGGGGGAGGSGGHTGGVGGAGGNGANVSMSAQTISVTGYISAAAGGGGGAGGADTANGLGGGGGAGGSSGEAGIGGNGNDPNNNNTGGGGGGGGGALTANDGGFSGNTGPTPHTPFIFTGGNGASSSQFNGGTGGTYAAGGLGGGGAVSGGNGGAIGQDGTSSGSVGAGNLVAGGVSGQGGVVTLTAKTVAVSSTLYTFYNSLPAYHPANPQMSTYTHFQDSILTAGPGNGVTIQSFGSATTLKSQQYATTSDLTDPTKSNTLKLNTFGVFSVGSAAAGNGTLGKIEAVSGTNTINFLAEPSLIATGTNVANTGKLTITEAGNPVSYFNNSSVSASELIALVQVGTTGKQPLTLDAAGLAVPGGTFSITALNVPAGTFGDLTIPAGVTGSAMTSINVSGTGDGMARVNGTLSFPLAGTLTAVGIEGTGTISTSAGGVLNLAAVNDIGGQGAISVNANFLSAKSTLGVVAINNTSTLAAGLTLFASNASNSSGKSFTLSNNSSITVNGALTGSDINLIANSGSIKVSAPIISGNNLTLTVSGTGTITQSFSSLNVGNTLVINSGSGAVTLGPTGSLLSTTDLVLSAGGNVTVNDTASNLIISSSTVGGILNVTNSGKIALHNITLQADATFTSSAYGILGVVASSGNVNFGTNGTFLEISANPGSMINASGNVNFNAGSGQFQFAQSTLNIQAANVNINANSVGFDPAGSLAVTGNATVNAYAIFNPSSLTVSGGGQRTFNIPTTGGPTLGMIAQTGDYKLNGTTVVNAGGKSLAIVVGGNIETGTGLTTINLLNNKGDGGSLYLFAGADFSQSSYVEVPGQQVFTINGASPSGGSVNLANVSINTSSTSATGGNAGNVFVTAFDSPTNLGQIYLGSITANSSTGTGGTVQLVAPGGVVAGAISATGKLAGGIVNVTAMEPNLPNFAFARGFISPLAGFALGSIGNGASTINGSVTTTASGSTGVGGSVTVLGGGNTTIKGGVTTTGGAGGGLIDIESGVGNISVLSAINSSGSVSQTLSTVFQNAGDAGVVQLLARQAITASTITAAGGSKVGAGFAGAGGAVQLQVNGSAANVGQIVVGAINATGGNSQLATGGATGGNAGSVSLLAGDVRIIGVTAANGAQGSVITSGGKFASVLTGSILISTSDVQNLPVSLDFTSAVPSVVALPGAIFNVGNSAINGSVGSLIAGPTSTDQITAANGGASIGGSGLTRGGASVTITSQARTLTEGGNVVSITPRSMITGAEAAALFGPTRGAASQTVALNASKQAIQNPNGGNPIDSMLTIETADVPVFTKLVVASADANGQAMQMIITGPVPQIALPAGTSIKGTLNFIDSGATAIVSSASALTIPVGGQIVAQGNLLLQASSITNNGLINANKIVLIAPNSFATLINNGTLSAVTTLSLPGNALPTMTQLTNNGGAFTAAINFETLQLPNALSNAAAFAPGSTPTANVTVRTLFTGALHPQIGGSLLGTGVSFLTLQSLASGTTGTPLDIAGTANLAPTTSLIVNTSGLLTLAPQATLSGNTVSITAAGISSNTSTIVANTTLTVQLPSGALNSQGDAWSSTHGAVSVTALNASSLASISFGSGTILSGATGMTIKSAGSSVSLAGSIATASGALTVSAKNQISLADATAMSAGTAGTGGSTPPSTGIVDISDIVQKGSMTFTVGAANVPGAFTFGNNDQLSSIGGNLNITAFGGDITMGQNNKVSAIGGNVVILTSANISGGTGNTFNAQGTGTGAFTTTVGGGVELGAGTTMSQLLLAAGLTPGLHPPTLNIGTGLTITPGTGVVNVNRGTTNQGSIDMSNSTFTINPSGGIVLDALNAHTINMQGATITVSAAKPVAFVPSSGAEIEVDDQTAGSKRSQKTLARILVAGCSGWQKLAGSGERYGRNAGESINMVRGELLINPLVDTTVTLPGMTVVAKAGAFVTFSVFNETTRVSVCSGPGDVTAIIGDRKVAIGPGEELVIGASTAADGVGRRQFKQFNSGNVRATICEFSIPAMLSNKDYLDPLCRPQTHLDKALASRVLKTAAVLQQVTAGHGAFQAQRRCRTTTGGSAYKAVSCNE